MLQEFLNALSRSVSTTPFVNSYGGGSNIPPKAAFGKMFNTLLGAFTGNPANINNPMGGYNTQAQGYGQTVQAYTNSIAGGQGFFNGVQTSRREAFSPGAVINTLEVPPQQMIPNSYSQVGQLTAAINPLQGFANSQAGVTTGAIPGAVTGTFGGNGFAQPGQYMPGPNGFMPANTGIFGKWSTLLMPLISLVGLVKSLFGLRGLAGSLQPVQIDKDALDYRVSLQNYDKAQHTDGSFDDDYWGESGEGDSGSGFESSNLEM